MKTSSKAVVIAALFALSQSLAFVEVEAFATYSKPVARTRLLPLYFKNELPPEIEDGKPYQTTIYNCAFCFHLILAHDQ